MTLSSNAPAPTPPPAPAKTAPRLRATTPDDYPRIERLEASHGLLTMRGDHWLDLWRNNPVRSKRGDRWQAGWVLEDDSGKLVGSLANVPTMYTYQGRELVAATGRAWVVEPEYRGVALWLMEEYFLQERVDLFINTTVNALAVDAFCTYGSARVPLGDWETAWYWVTGYRGFAASALRIKGVGRGGLLAPVLAAALRVKEAVTAKSLPGSPSASTLKWVDDFGPEFDGFWAELVRNNPEKLLAIRDVPTLRWHFAGALGERTVWVLTARRNGLLRAYCILKRQDHPPSGLVRMRLADYQNLDHDRDTLSTLLRESLRRCAAEGIHVLEHVGGDLPKMAGIDRFAPYRRKLHSWPFYYKAIDPEVEAALRKPEVWDPSAFDGDTSL